MAKSKAYMVEVEVAEDEPEDVAVRRYMKLVMQSRVVEQLRNRKTKESKKEEWKRRFRERCEARKAEKEAAGKGIYEPRTFAELYNHQDLIARPFEDFYCLRDEGDEEPPSQAELEAEDIFGSFNGGSYVDNWGTYGTAQQPTTPAPSGTASTWTGGYI